MIKTKKRHFIELFLQVIRYLAWSDPPFDLRVDDDIVKTDEACAADIRRTRYIGDFLQWKNHDAYRKAFDELLKELKSTNKVGV
jgi:hypothetical protein